MDDRADTHQHVRRVVLPSGKKIDVVSFDEPGTPRATPRDPQHDLHLCGRCGSDLVYPLEWAESGPAAWEIELRCPNCEWSDWGVYDQERVDRFDDALDRGMVTLVDNLKRLAHANMEEEIERFVAALQVDAILPEDFGAPAPGEA